MRYRKTALLLVLIHAALAVHAAWNLSPVWDEIIYPAAGYDLLTTGRMRTSFDHPPLGKALLGLPLLLQGVPHVTAPARLASIDSFRYGFDFVHHNNRPPRWMIFIPRLMSILLSCLLAILIYLYACQAWGDEGGLLAIGLYAFLPPVLARASLALLEMPLAFFMTVAVLGAARWRTERKRQFLVLWALGWTAALLTKANALILLPVFLISDVLAAAQKKRPLLPRLTETALVSLAALGSAEIVMRVFGKSYWIDQLLARESDLLASRFPIYFHGTYWNSAMFYMAPAAWLLKTPVPFVALAFGGWFLWRRTRPKEEAYILLSCLFLVTGLLMVSTRSIIATGQYFFLYPFLAVTAAAVASVQEFPVRLASKVLVGSMILSCLWVHPGYLSYFNILAGGSSHGDRWLSDSDQDWGQGLPALADWIKREKLSQILLGYSGAGDPRVYGIAYQDVISPALITATYRGEIFAQWPGRLVLVLSCKVAQTESALLGWLLKNREPVAKVGNTFLVYDLTHDKEALDWLSWFYRFTRRPIQASHLPKA